MPEYRLYHFCRGQTRRFEELSADDDGDAIEKAERLVSDDPAELWRGKRLLKALLPSKH